MAAIKPDFSRALAALTSAALGLPGLDLQAATPGAQAQGNVQYGYYQESDNRMKVEVYHGDFSLPVTDRLEFTFSVDRDTYSGATPSFSLPETMTNKLRFDDDNGLIKSDAVSAASGLVTSQGVTTYELDTFKEVADNRSQSEVQLDAAREQAKTSLRASIDSARDTEDLAYRLANPEPGYPTDSITTTQLLTFSNLGATTFGKANVNLGATCPQGNCYKETGDNFAVGTLLVSDTDPTAHLHRHLLPGSNRSIQYHADSAGIYIREIDGKAFNLVDMLFKAPISGDNPGAPGIPGYWELLGFNEAVNPNLPSGDGTNYATRVAYQTVANGFDNILTLNDAFKNIKAFWVHFQGYPSTPADLAKFDLVLDDINLNPVPAVTPQQEAWLSAYNQFLATLNSNYQPQYAALTAQNTAIDQQFEAFKKQAKIEIYRNFLNGLTPPNTRSVQRFQTQPIETRTQPVFGAKYYLDSATLALSGGQSNEPDFNSTFGSVNYSHEINNKLTTISAGYNYTNNKISRNTGGHSTDTGHSGHSENEEGNDVAAIYPDLNGNSHFNAFNLGLSQILSKNSLLQLSFNYTHQSGYLTNPYKFVYVRGEITPEEYYGLSQGEMNWNDVTRLEVAGLELFREVRPDLRNQFSFSTRLNQYLPALDAALHMDYRYYRDDWGIDSHTLELKWLQKLPFGLSVTPGLRYYSQSRADFFAPYFLAPRADGHYSSDFRLSGYGALSGGLTVAKQFSRGIRLELGMEYYTHQGNLKLGGGGESDYADFNYWMTHANLSIDLSAPGQMFGAGAGDPHHHHHHGTPLPAGIMFGHMLNEADGLMAGYRYMYANQSGDMRNGSSAISDTALLNAHCGPSACTERPTQMSMHMHMLDLMYAPSDWLNLMIMPQLVDMDMELTPLAGSTGTGEHGGGHETHGLGDTQAAALVKVFDQPGQHMHVSLGISAPTGSVEQTLDGRDEADSNLQDYGMQLGSGTWDFKPSLTYTGQMGDWSWGAQLGGTKRLNDRNPSGYALGDQFQVSSWGGYSISQWLSATLRGVYTEQGKIRGEFNRSHAQSAPVDVTANYGGKFWDVGFGVNLRVPNGVMAGHHFSLEWLQPVADQFNGYQLQREGGLSATWSYAF